MARLLFIYLLFASPGGAGPGRVDYSIMSLTLNASNSTPEAFSHSMKHVAGPISHQIINLDNAHPFRQQQSLDDNMMADYCGLLT